MKVSLTREHWAQLGITVQFLALVRTLAEFWRLRYVLGGDFTVKVGTPYITGGLIAALSSWIAATLYFFLRYIQAVVVTVAMVGVLLVYKFMSLGW